MERSRFALVFLVLAGVGFLLPFDATKAAAAGCVLVFVLLLASDPALRGDSSVPPARLRHGTEPRGGGPR
jgi:hypothetical protein